MYGRCMLSRAAGTLWKEVGDWVYCGSGNRTNVSVRYGVLGVLHQYQ